VYLFGSQCLYAYVSPHPNPCMLLHSSAAAGSAASFLTNPLDLAKLR
jgi:hypothetical protein